MSMPNYLKMPKKSQVLALLELGWSYRRIQGETGVRRETVSEYDKTRQANAAKTFPGSDPSPPPDSPDISRDEGPNPAKRFAGSGSKPAKTFPGSSPRSRFAAAVYRTAILEKLDVGLSLPRIWQDLVEDYGYGASYESVKRFVRTLAPTRRAVGVFHCAPGAETQVDFFRGAPTLDAATGEWRRPWVFRMTLGHSRHGYEEAVWDQKLETFLRLHERAFRDLGGVPTVVRSDNLKAAVVRACFFDPDSHDVYLAFATHWGFTPLPTQPRRPEENGKQERSGGYVKDNALKGRRFDSLDAQNAFLRHWNRTIARLRIHGTTRRQVWTHFVEVEQRALHPLAGEVFPLFTSGERTVHTDGHVEVGGAFYPVPLALLGQRLRVRWDAHLVRVFHGDTLVMVHARVAAGVFAPRAGEAEASSRQQAFVDRLVGQCERVGPAVKQWADAALAARGVRAIRLIQGVLALTRRHPRERILAAVTEAHTHQHFRYQTIRQLVERTQVRPTPALATDDPAIRPMTQYTLEDFLQ
jgi:transposase